MVETAEAPHARQLISLVTAYDASLCDSGDDGVVDSHLGENEVQGALADNGGLG